MTGVDPSLILPGSYASVSLADGAAVSMPDEAMEEISDIENGNPRYTVYKISDEDKQILDLATVPTFEKQVHGSGDFVAISSGDIREIQYAGGRLVLETPLNDDDVVQLATGKYVSIALIYGALTSKVSDKSIMKEATPIGSLAKKNFPTIDEFSLDLDILFTKIAAQLVVNDLTVTHQKGGTSGNAISFAITNPETTHTLSIAIVGNAITVTLGYAGGAITSTNQDVVDICNMSPEVQRLGIVVECDAEDASSLASAFTSDTLIGGENAINYASKKDSLIAVNVYGDTDDSFMWQGLGYIESADTDFNPEDLIKQSIKIACYGKLYFRPR